MKEASGELNMTVVTIIAIAGIAGFFTLMFNGPIKNAISDQWGKVNTDNYDRNQRPQG